MNFIKTLILFSILNLQGFAQNNSQYIRINNFYSEIITEITNNKLLFIENEGLHFSSLMIESEKKYDGEIKIFYKVKNEIENFLISKIDNKENSENLSFDSGLHLFGEEQKVVKIDFGEFKGKVKITLIFAPKIEVRDFNKLKKFSNPCGKPPMISYTDWRKGLPAPTPPREKTTVEHLVIHHSAGSNTDTDYINTVRNIYLLHTQSNGWDDIGYNFLIAPDGTIFNGRDPLGAGEDDNILGAHFCSKNQNTMGICLLGNFMTKKPDNRAIFSLKYLLAWKLKKEKINAFGKTKHPQPDGNLLDNICGHRNGCSTSCPGDSLYDILSDVRIEAARIADSCGLILDNIEPIENGVFSVYPNPSKNKIFFKLNEDRNAILKVLNLNGSMFFEGLISSEKCLELNFENGMYFYWILSEDKILAKGKFLIKK